MYLLGECRVISTQVSLIEAWSIWKAIVSSSSQIHRLDNDYISAHSWTGAKPSVWYKIFYATFLLWLHFSKLAIFDCIERPSSMCCFFY